MDEQESPGPTMRGRKVRIACRRCRDRRIKYDGQVPACGKCAKASVACIDVDSRMGERQIPRAYQAGATARLEWLEGLVRDRLPDVDLDSGPTQPNSGSYDQTSQPPNSEAAVQQMQDQASAHSKRPRSQSDLDNEASMRKRARLMAVDLGLLSLDINASQVRYLGSSSGSFFASLLQGRDGNIVGESEAAARDCSDGAHYSDVEGAEEQSSHHSRSLFQILKDLLPSRTECNSLIEHFFRHYHPDYPVLHKPSFHSLVDKLYASAEVSGTEILQPNGWPVSVAPFHYNGETSRMQGSEAIAIPARTAAAQLLFVLSIAAHLKTRKRPFAMDPTKYHEQALNLAQTALSDVSLSSLQVLILSILQSFLTPQDTNTWIILHAAMACAIDLGLHRDVSALRRFSPVAAQMRRRIFFCAYVLDRLVSTAQGRPLGFQDDTLDLSLLSTHASENELRTDSDSQDQARLPYSVARFEWATLLSRIKYQLYRFRVAAAPEALASFQDELTNLIEAWLAHGMHVTEGFAPPERFRLQVKLKIDYHFIRCLLYQPSQACLSPDAVSLQRCFESATQRIRLYDSLYDQSHLYMSWPTTHGILLAGATLVYCIWTSPQVRSTVTISTLAKDFRLCSNLLTLGGEWWPLAQRGRRSFERLADSTIESLTKHPVQPLQQHELGMGFEGGLDDNFFSLNFQSPSTNIETILQSFLQDELPLPDMLDIIDATTPGQTNVSWSNDQLFNLDAPFGTSGFG